jgi:hypothetical protein
MSRNASSIADFPEVAFEKITLNLLQERFWTASGLPTICPGRGTELHDARLMVDQHSAESLFEKRASM